MTTITIDQVLRDIVETIREPLLVLDSDLKVVFANRSFFNTFKVTSEETLGNFIYNLGNQQWNIPQLRKLLEDIIPNNDEFNDYEIEHDFPSIGHKKMFLNARRLIEKETNFERIFLSIEDVTERIELKTLLEDSENRFRRLFETANDGILLLEKRKLKIYQGNPSIMKMLGYSNEEVIGKDINEIGIPIDIRNVQEILQNLEKDGIIYYKDIPAQNKAGNVIDTDIYLVDKATLIQCNVRDITEHKRLEEELLRAQKLESLGLLAGGIAHDFNNILTTIVGNISLAKIDVSPEDKIFDLLTETEAASARANKLTKQLLTFAKGGAPLKEVALIKELLKESCSFVMKGSKTILEFSIAQDLWPAEVDVGQISQVIHNLVINANQSMPEGGTIQVAADNLIIDKKQGFPLKPGKYIRISIKDQGVGIAGKHIKNIFDPYFTTKQKGSGLGLATTYSIIKKHDGHIMVESQLDVGTTFHIYLPASDKIVTEKEEVELIKGLGRILLMDDDASLRKTVGAMLVMLGYEAEYAQDGSEAIQMYKKAQGSGQSYDAVIMDLTIPGGMGGKEAISKLLEIDSEVTAIVSSGYAEDLVLENFQDYGFKGMISKPYDAKSLSNVLYDVLQDEK